jgi:hypothetical protein
MRLTRYWAAKNPPSRGVPEGKSAGKNLWAWIEVPKNQGLMLRVRVISRAFFSSAYRT